MSDESKKEPEKGFGEGIEIVKDQPKEEKDIEINMGSILSFFKKKDEKAQKSSEHNAPEPKRHEEEKADEEIDLGKIASGIKGIFKGEKGGGKTAEAKGADAEDISINIKSAAEFLGKWGGLILLISGILTSMALTAQVRLAVSGLPFTNEWAENSVYNTIQSDASNAINARYPNLPDAKKNQILAEETSKARKTGKYQFQTGQFTGVTIDIKEQIKGTSEQIKDFYRDENGRPYSPDIDPYYWHRYAKNIVETGYIGDEVKNGVQWDNRQLAPLGRPIYAEDSFFPHFLAYLYKTMKAFNRPITLWAVQTVAYPVLLTALTVLLVFLIARKIAGNVGGFLGSLMAGLHAAYVNRTIHGDNDAVVIFFAILTLWLFIEAIHSRKFLLGMAMAAASGFSASLFSIVWGGWWFILLFIIAASMATIASGIIRTLIESRWSIKETLKAATKGAIGKLFIAPTAIFLASTGLFIGIFTGFDRFTSVPMLAFGITKLKAAVLTQSYWPNVLTTVAELNEGSFQQVMNQIKPGIFSLAAISIAALLAYALIQFAIPFVKGKGKEQATTASIITAAAMAAAILAATFALWTMVDNIPPKFMLGAAGAAVAGAGAVAISLMFLSDKIEADWKKGLYAIFFATLIAAWFISTIYASTKGIRFVLLLTPAVGIGFGITLGMIYKLTLWTNEKFLKIPKMAVAIAIFAVLAMSTYSTNIKQDADNIARHDIPIINDAWYGSLKAIEADSNESAIITSWWDFGHHFKEITGRRVTFDGTTQQGPQAHWVGKFFMTSSETEAAGMLRMLDCGSNTAFDVLNNIRNDFAGSVKILYQITAIPSKDEAERTLVDKYRLTPEQAMNVTRYTHCTPPEAYVIASEDMTGKSGVWGHFGSWDFEKATVWQTLRGKTEKEAVSEMKRMFNYSEEKAKATYSEAKRIRTDNDANTWIAPWPSFSNDISGCSVMANNENEKIAACNNGLVVNLTTNDAYFPAQEGAALHPVSFVYLTNETGEEQVVEKIYTNNTVPQRISVILVPQGNGYISIMASPETAAGMYTKMFFFGGKGLKHFKLLTHQTGMTGTNVYVYKADWESLWNSTP